MIKILLVLTLTSCLGKGEEMHKDLKKSGNFGLDDKQQKHMTLVERIKAKEEAKQAAEEAKRLAETQQVPKKA